MDAERLQAPFNSLSRYRLVLQGGLQAQGIVVLLNSVRRDLVVGYRPDPRFDMGQVDGHLGDSRHGSFTRWLCAGLGVTPVGWRSKRRH